jgi:hypothetical protein
VVVSFNKTSLHTFYRERLAEAYLERGPDGERGVRLSDVDNAARGGPYPLIFGTLNLLGYRAAAEKTCHFLFSPLYCGSEVTGYRKTADDGFWGGCNDLATVTAISGAAVSPVQLDSLPLALFMLLANVRLGQWVRHPRHWYPWGWPVLGRPNAFALLREALRDAEDRQLCMVTDGGHSENLGLWPLLERKCRLILVSDAAEDSAHSLSDFLKLCRRIRVHHGIQFLNLLDNRPIDLGAIQLEKDATSRYHFFVGRVRYPESFRPDLAPGGAEEEGYLIYLKPSLTRDEDNDLLRHFKEHPPFPHDPTLNQLYDADKVESYRQLGFHIGEVLCGRLYPPDVMWQAGRRLAVVDELFQHGLFHGTGGPGERELGQAFHAWEESPGYREDVVRRVRQLIDRAKRVTA